MAPFPSPLFLAFRRYCFIGVVSPLWAVRTLGVAKRCFDLTTCSSLIGCRTLSITSAPKAYGGAPESGQRDGCQLPQQRPQPAQLGLLRVHWHDPGGKRASVSTFVAQFKENLCIEQNSLVAVEFNEILQMSPDLNGLKPLNYSQQECSIILHQCHQLVDVVGVVDQSFPFIAIPFAYK